MEFVSEVRAFADRGLEGDRFFRASWMAANRPDKAVSLIEEETLQAAANALGREMFADKTRRNIVTRGAALIDLLASSSAVKSDDLIRFTRQAETLGFYCVTVADHVIVPKNISVPYPYTVDGKYPGTGYHLETLMTMSFLAGATQRIRLATSVMIAPYRNPIITAKMLASLDVLSHGRVIVGLGVGWMKEEFENLKAPRFEDRGRVTDEYIKAFRELWTK